MDYLPKDFDQCMYNVFRLDGKKEKALTVFPNLKLYKEFKGKLKEKLDKEKIFKYIVAMYDKESPVVRKVSDVNKRKKECAKIAEFDATEEGELTDNYADVMNCHNPQTTAMIIRYVRQHRLHKYSLLVASEESFYKDLSRMMSGADINIGDLKKAEQLIESTSIELLNQDNNRNLIDDLFVFIEQEQLNLKPEHIAEKLAKGEDPIAT